MNLYYRFTRRAVVFAAAFALALPGALPGVQVAFAEEDDDQIIEEVVVTGIRGSLRQSLDMKRDADNVMDALVAEDIGKFPDQNLAESLQRISGVAIDRMRGEGAAVSIRGLGPQFTRVLVNGRGALSGGTQAFAGNIGDHSQQRTFRFESMQAELVQAVEVYKSVQANLLEGGMGGTINIRTRRPFDNGGRRIVAGNVFMTDDALADENGYRFAGVYSDAFADNTLGFLVSVAGDDRTTREDWFNVTDYEAKVFNNAINLATGELLRGCDLPGIANPDVGCGYAFGNVRQGILVEDIQRINASAALQWRPNEQWDVTADILYSQMDRDYDDFQVPWRPQAGLANGASEVLLDENQIVTYIRTETARPRPFQRPRVEDIETQQFAVNAKYTPTENWTLNFDVSHSIGDRVSPYHESYYDVPAVPMTYDIRDGYIPKLSVEANLLDPNLYDFIVFSTQVRTSRDTESQYRFDATYHFDDGTAFHAGVSFRDRERSWQRRGFRFGPRYGDFPGAKLTDVEYAPVPIDNAFSGIKGSGSWPSDWLLQDQGNVRDTYLIGRRDEIDPVRFEAANTAHAEEFDITEDTLALYFMVEMSGTIGDFPWSGNVGARWIEVDRASTGNVQPVENMVFLETAGNWEFELGPAEFQTHGNRFAEMLPSLNLKFELREDLIARFAWGKVMTQPAFADLNPGGTKHASTRRVQEGDPNLEPYIAEQLDIGIEWYPTDDSIIALQAFGKQVDSFIVQISERRDWVEPDGSTLYDPESGGNVRLIYQGPVNGDGAFIGGIEFAAQYAFTQLPSPFDGLGVIFNHTWVDTDAEFINPSSGVAFDVPGLSRNTTNAVIFYEKYKVSARVAWNQRESFLTSISSLRGNPQFTSDYWQLDAGFGYQVTDNISVVFEAINITDENVDQYNIVGPVSRLEQLYFISNSGRRMQAGVRVRL